MGIKEQEFITKLKDFDSACLDTALFIYHLGEIEPYFALTEHVFEALIDERLKGFVSAVSVFEFVVKPFSENHLQEINNFEQVVSSLAIEDIYCPPPKVALLGEPILAKVSNCVGFVLRMVGRTEHIPPVEDVLGSSYHP